METLFEVVQTILGLGATVILPIMITILGLVFRLKIGEALKAGISVGVGFLGLTLIVDLLTNTLKPAIKYYQSTGSGFTITDIGWPAVGAAAWVVPFAALTIPLGLLLNLALVRLKWTQTLNVDIWNYMHFLIPGALAYYLMDSFWLGLSISLILSVVALFIGDKIADNWQNYFGLEGTTCTTLIFTGWAYPVFWIINKIIDVIPGLNKLDLSLKKLDQKLGVFGSPMMVGVIVGLLLGILTQRPYTEVLTMGIGIGGVMALMPKMVSVMMEGLSPIGKAAKKFMHKYMGNSRLNIGMDVALGLGDPATITTTVVSIPIIILLALVLPAVKLFPIGLLMSVVYISVLATLVSKGNILRAIISTVVLSVITFYLEAIIAPGATKMLNASDVSFSGLASDFTFATPWNLVIYWLSNLI